ncbi:MAG: hypothetical protein ACYC8T_32950 [Myxococcaceae bacterium]
MNAGRAGLLLGVLLAWVQALGQGPGSQPAAGPLPGMLRITQLNRLGPSFRLERSEYRVDGPTVFAGTGELGLLDLSRFPIHDGELSPGRHTLHVELQYRAPSAPGGRLRVHATFPFEAPRGGEGLVVRVIAFERGARPELRFETEASR